MIVWSVYTIKIVSEWAHYFHRVLRHTILATTPTKLNAEQTPVQIQCPPVTAYVRIGGNAVCIVRAGMRQSTLRHYSHAKTVVISMDSTLSAMLSASQLFLVLCLSQYMIIVSKVTCLLVFSGVKTH